MDPKNLQTFATTQALADWFARHSASETEVWVQIHKKATGLPSVTWEDCVIEALRVGWIDGIKKSLGPEAYAQRLTPRKKGSGWSMRNRNHCEALIRAGRMTPAGLAEVTAAKADGRWEAAYAGPAQMVIPEWFLVELDHNPAAKTQFQTLDRQNLFAVYHRLQTAKTDNTRASRMSAILAMLAAGKTFH